MSKVINIGVLGIGRMGWGVSKNQLSNWPDKFKLVAICDLIEERVEKAREEIGCKVYTDYEEMLKQEDLQMVYIATRSCDHHKHAMMAFEAGKHVVLEKPVTISYEEALDLYQHFNKEGAPRLFVHQQRRLEDGFNKVREIVESGVLGKVYEINTEQNGFQHRDDWQTLSEFGGGQLLNWGPHIIDQSLQLLGTPLADIESYLCHVTAGGDCEDHLRIRFIGDNNRVVNMSISGATALKCGRYFEAYGDRGALIYEDGKMKIKYINPEQEIPPVVSSRETPGASFGKSGTFESALVIDWITEELEVPVESRNMWNYWTALYDSLTEGKEFFITDNDILAIMRTISTVKAQNKYIME